MDFDSLKVTAKINSGYDSVSSEPKAVKAYKPEINTNVDTNAGVGKATAVSTDNNQAAADNSQKYTSEEYIQKLSNAIDIANENLKSMMIRKEFSYRIHEETNRVIVDVKNSETGEIIREIPSEDDLDMIAKMQELAGIFIDEKR